MAAKGAGTLIAHSHLSRRTSVNFSATIQGLNIRLDTPELISAWIAERRKRWPTRDLVEAKERQRAAGRQRGELNSGKGRNAKRPAATTPQQERVDGTEAAKRVRLVLGNSGVESTKDGPALAGMLDYGSDSDGDGPVDADGKAKADAGNDDSDSSSGSDSDSGSDSEDSGSGSDMDPERDAVSSKAPIETQAHAETEAPRPAQWDRRPVCKFWRQGRCGFGESCRLAHQVRIAPVVMASYRTPLTPSLFIAPSATTSSRSIRHRFQGSIARPHSGIQETFARSQTATSEPFRSALPTSGIARKRDRAARQCGGSSYSISVRE